MKITDSFGVGATTNTVRATTQSNSENNASRDTVDVQQSRDNSEFVANSKKGSQEGMQIKCQKNKGMQMASMATQTTARKTNVKRSRKNCDDESESKSDADGLCVPASPMGSPSLMETNVRTKRFRRSCTREELAHRKKRRRVNKFTLMCHECGEIFSHHLVLKSHVSKTIYF